MRLIDLSLELCETPSERIPPRIRYVDHARGAEEMSQIFGVPPDRWPDGLGWAGEEVTLITHAGTHMDAPYHYGPSSGGERARYIGEVPLEWCFAPGVVLDFRAKGDGEEITAADLDAAVCRIGRLAPGDIVLLMTGADRHWGQADYPDRGCGLGREGTLHLLEQGIRVIGIDAWGLDRSFAAMRAEYQRSGDPSSVWASHFAGRLRGYCQLEKLTHLDRLPPAGFRIACFPIKVARAGAGWCRVVAFVDGAHRD